MSDNDLKKKRYPLKNLPPDRFQPKVLFIWLAVAAAVLILISLTSQKTSSIETLKLQTVIELAEKGDILSGVIQPNPSGGRDWADIKGDLKKTGADGKPVRFASSGRLTDGSMDRLVKVGVFDQEPATNAFSQILVSVVPFVVIIGLLYFLFVRQLRSAGRGALSFGKSRAKLLTRDRDKISFTEVAG